MLGIMADLTILVTQIHKRWIPFHLLISFPFLQLGFIVFSEQVLNLIGHIKPNCLLLTMWVILLIRFYTANVYTIAIDFNLPIWYPKTLLILFISRAFKVKAKIFYICNPWSANRNNLTISFSPECLPFICLS